MSVEQVLRKSEQPISALRTNTNEIILAEGVPSPVTSLPSFEHTQTFFSALSFPIDRKNLPRPFGYQKVGRETYKMWVRNWEILGKHLGTDAVLKETGKKHKITRERTRQIVEKLVSESFNAAPVPLKKAFPRASLGTEKPYSLHKAMRKSEAFGGKMRQVVEAVLSGKDYEEIRRETGVSVWALENCRSIGIDIPHFNEALGKEYQENLRFLAAGILDDRQILEIFKDIEERNRRGICMTLRKAGVLVPLSKAARNEGVFIHNSDPATHRILKNLGIPVVHIGFQFTDKNGKQKVHPYFFVLNNHERTREAFSHPSFDAFRKNPVEVLGRVPEEIPTTSIRTDPGYIHVGRLIKERRIPIKAESARKYLGPDVPVPVFCIRSRGLLVRKEAARFSRLS